VTQLSSDPFFIYQTQTGITNELGESKDPISKVLYGLIDSFIHKLTTDNAKGGKPSRVSIRNICFSIPNRIRQWL